MRIKIGKRVLVIELNSHEDSFEYLLEQIASPASSIYPKIPLIKSMRNLSIQNPSLFEKHGIPLESYAPPNDDRCVSLRCAKDFVETHYDRLVGRI